MAGVRQKNFARRSAAEAFLHLLELPQGNSHAETLPAATKLQKQKRRAKFSRTAIGDWAASMMRAVLVPVLVGFLGRGRRIVILRNRRGGVWRRRIIFLRNHGLSFCRNF